MGKSKDSIEIVKTDLQIEEELDAHRRGWAAQRVGLLFILALVLLAAAGLFGNGVASKQTLTQDQITIESERFYRFEARLELKIKVAHLQGNELTVSFPNHYIQNFRVDSILPEPNEHRTTDGNVSYTFEGNGNMDITFFLIPNSRGNVEGDLGINGKIFRLKHFIYP